MTWRCCRQAMSTQCRALKAPSCAQQAAAPPPRLPLPASHSTHRTCLALYLHCSATRRHGLRQTKGQWALQPARSTPPPWSVARCSCLAGE